MFDIRRINSSDHDAIVQLWHQGWHDAHAQLVPEGVLEYRTPEYFRKWLQSSDDEFWVAVDGDVLGFVSANGDELVKLYVLRKARGTGIAQTLLSRAEQQIQDKGFPEAKVFCTAGNSRAEKFYIREGWSLSRTFRDQLWLPETTTRRFDVRTHCYRKKISSISMS
ncbi:MULTISPECIES: GNAT family N-acetyltransferase [unclassified Pseudovibrio]|uniref:GNAT family N-acetyltransferase n=1 Tax=unclassified Pseudovibrio TaxID=2627060 RepID=UPI0007AE7576|nr:MULTISPECIES: GNAT family N-acetyltransferase [unclassified Pseudovibrio]KZK95259.1 putative acetyltransferase [Pseudovibrio sp. W74]KZL10780.1 putative acetyltransferase [Pseudovibrio sp. Ad14]